MRAGLALIIFVLIALPFAGYAQDWLSDEEIGLTPPQDVLGLQQERGYFDLFNATTKERTARKLAELEGDISPGAKISVDSLVERFINNCFTQTAKNPQTDEKIKEFMCLCSAANVVEDMEPEDIRTMFSDDDEARFQQERMLGLSVIPCMKKPLNHLIM